MKFVGITKRWFLSVASIILAILITVALSMFLSFRSYYYGFANMTLDSYSGDEMTTVLNLYADSNSSSFETAAREYVSNFADKNTVAVWAVDASGKILLSSSGFSIGDDVEMPDFTAAMQSNEGTAKWTGRLPSGEKIMAASYIIRYSNGEIAGAVRFMVSLRVIDEQLAVMAMIIVAAALLMFAVVMVSSIVFIRSIVNPVKSVGETAKRIADGDLAARIDHYPYNDEIGELCNTINDMAAKLSTADRMKNDFISTISHELRTPLTAIKGWGETLLQIGDTDPAMTERGMGVIISEATRLNDMVEELLDFSRMSSGRMKLVTEKMDALAELDEVVFTFKERAIKEGIEIVYNVPSLPAPMTGDPSRIKQVFYNILDNALKYSEEGGKIVVLVEMPNPASLVISFCDYGSGIPAEDLLHVKEKFYKANTTVRGSGIGLAVADEIIRLHRGTLDIDSVYGEGTTVRITLPIDPSEYETPEREGDNKPNEQEAKN